MIYKIADKMPRVGEKHGFIAPSAELIGDVTISEGVSIWFNAVIRGDLDSVFIGKNTNIQDCCVIHVDRGAPSIVGEGCTIGHGAVIHGCSIGNHCLIGMNAVILSGAKIADECLIAAGSLVPQGMVIPPRSLVIGSPARVVKELKEGMVEGIKKNSALYTSCSAEYLATLSSL